LVDQFLEDICSDYGIAKKNIDDDAIKLLKEYDWTGNIRELRNVVERLVILSAKTITEEDVKSYVMPR
jgi:two-component system nitrogen regulation response regulator NtrX